MATNNIINVGLSGQSGTGAFAGNVSPIFTTPNIGVADATSINFGISALNYYASNMPLVPSVTYAVPGDLSVAYLTRSATYNRLGTVTFIRIALEFTPTFTTASGLFQITNAIPFVPITTIYGIASPTSNNWAYAAGTTQMLSRLPVGSTVIDLRTSGSSTPGMPINASNMTSGTLYSLFVYLFLFV